MAFFDELKEKVTSATISVGNKVRASVGEAGRISEEKRDINAEIASIYGEIGRIYYETNGADVARMHPLCRRISELHARLEALDVQEMKLDKAEKCPSCGAAMPKEAKFCSNCGKHMPDAGEEAAPDMSYLNFCKNCGAMYAKGETRCAICGEMLPQAE